MNRYSLFLVVTFFLLCLAEDSVASPDSQKPDLERLDALLVGLESLGFSGAVAAGFVDGPELAKAYGLADRTESRHYEIDTVQTMGSITKPVTAAAVLVLESQGKLTLDQTLNDHFDDVPPAKQVITLHQLLTHSAGFPGSLGRDNDPIGTDEFLQLALAAELEFAPGTGYAYSNVGYSLLGIVIERVSGQGYEEFVHQQLFEPLGMTATGYVLPQWNKSQRAIGYRNGERWGEVVGRGWRPEGPGWNLRANGGLHTTVEDMQQWVRILIGEGPLDQASVERWTEGYVDEGGGDSFYAYGWAVSDSPLGKLVAHNGGNGIFSADFLWFPDANFYLYIQGNTATLAAAELRPLLLSALLEPEFPLPPALPDTSNPANAADHAGTWSGEAGKLSLSADGTRLVAEVAGPGLLRALNEVDGQHNDHLDLLDTQTLQVLERLREGRDDVLEGFVQEDIAGRNQRLIVLFERFPEETRIEFLGSLPIADDHPFSELAAHGSFVRLQAPFGTRIATILWQSDGNYRATALGPTSDLPGLILVPVDLHHYQAVERQPPWRQVPVAIQENCLTIASQRLCRSD